MKLIELNKISIKEISNKELLRLHSRVHQLWGLSKRKRINPTFIKFLKDTHNLIIDEMIKRKLNHKSLLESYLFYMENNNVR